MPCDVLKSLLVFLCPQVISASKSTSERTIESGQAPGIQVARVAGVLMRELYHFSTVLQGVAAPLLRQATMAAFEPVLFAPNPCFVHGRCCFVHQCDRNRRGK